MTTGGGGSSGRGHRIQSDESRTAPGVSAEQWVTEHPDVLQELQRAYVEAGSKIVYAPTLRGQPDQPGQFWAGKPGGAAEHRLVKISREAVEGRAFVAGDLTTTGQLMEPKGDMTYEKLYHAYQEQVRRWRMRGPTFWWRKPC